MKATVLISSFLFILLCCQKPTQQAIELDEEQIENEARNMLTDYLQNVSQKGLTAEFDYLDSSNNFFWVPPGYHSTLKYDSIRTILLQNAKALQRVELQWDTLQIFPLSNEIATYSGIVKSNTTDTSGTKTSVSIIESGTLLKRKEGWKLLSGQSAVLPK